MSIEKLIEAAIAGGWKPFSGEGRLVKKGKEDGIGSYWYEWDSTDEDGNPCILDRPLCLDHPHYFIPALLDPLMWQSAGKVLGWPDDNRLRRMYETDSWRGKQFLFLWGIQEGKGLSEAVSEATNQHNKMNEEKPTLKDQTRWYGTYKGINFEIAKWKGHFTEETKKYDRGYTWNYYVYVKPRTLVTVAGFTEGTKRADYYAMYPDVEMHGGLTHWSRTIDSFGLHEVDTLGCDYAHLWDYEYEGSDKLREYTHEYILRDVKKTIDSLPEDLFFTPISTIK